MTTRWVSPKSQFTQYDGTNAQAVFAVVADNVEGTNKQIASEQDGVLTISFHYDNTQYVIVDQGNWVPGNLTTAQLDQWYYTLPGQS